MHAALPKLYPNSTKYRDAGAKPVTGRSGSAAIAVRALRGQTQTDIEVTTGDLESGSTPAGNLDKVQLKVFGGDGTLVATDNYKKSLTSGGYAQFSYTWVSRGQSIQVQASVSGLDANRTDVVTVETPVKLRPDIIVTDLEKLRVAKVRTNTIISATIREANGDVGAHANCVLKIDGVAVDRANGIWVDAGDSVACEFTYRFTSLGEKQLTVEATDVIPADYDMSNNSATGQINIVELGPEVPIKYLVGASERTTDVIDTVHHFEEYRFDNPDWNHTYDFTEEITGGGRLVFYQAIMFFDRKVTFPVLVESSLSEDGATVMQDSQNLSVTHSYGEPGYSECSVSVFDINRPRWFEVCTSDTSASGQPSGATYVMTWTQSGRTTYYSTWTAKYRDFETDSVYTATLIEGSGWGPQPTPSLGNHVEVHAVVTDRDNVNDVDAAVDLLQVLDYIPPTIEMFNTWDEPIANGRYSGYDHFVGSSHEYGRDGYAGGIDTR